MNSESKITLSETERNILTELYEDGMDYINKLENKNKKRYTMNYNISKELFEKVMKVELAGFSINEENVIGYIFNKVGYFEISVDTFFFKCKEWAYGQGYELESSKVQINSKFGHCSSPIIDGKSFISETEQQAVFDACQWILDNKDK